MLAFVALYRQRELINAMAYPNGTLSENGHFVRDPTDIAEHPGSIIWSGNGNVEQDSNTTIDFEESGLTCFSEMATVQTPIGKSPMKDLRVGDRILTGKNRYEKVYAFAHRNPQRAADFVAISTEDETLELTAPHLVFLQGHDNPIRADAVKVGDVLRGAKSVNEIKIVQRRGIYAPLIKSGTLVVNGVVSSAYVALQDTPNVVLGGVSTPLSHHNYIQLGMSPYRLYCSLSDKFCTSYNDDGMPPFVAFSIRLSHWVYAQNIILQFLYMASFFVVAGICCLLETPVGLAAGGALLLVWSKRGNNEAGAQSCTKEPCHG